MSRASAPGKIILFGEHAVVYGRPALAVPMTQVQATVDILEANDTVTDGKPDWEADKRMAVRAGDKSWGRHILIDAPDIGLFSTLDCLLSAPTPDPIASVIVSVFQALMIDSPPALKISIRSTIPVASGMGSGAAVSVALIRALSYMVQRPLSDEAVSALAFEAEKLYHGSPSGIDNTVVTYARPVYFVKGQLIETFRAKKPFTIVIGDTGISASTKTSVGDVRKLWEADKARWEKVFDAVGDIVRQARREIEIGDTDSLGPLMDANHSLLQEMTVSSPELDRLVSTARSAGALGAKLSGGGRGGNMIALVTPDKREQVEASLRAAGARRVLVTTVQS
jgi:mevalonate kinase